MHNFKLKSFLYSIIILIAMLLSACNGGAGVEDASSSALETASVANGSGSIILESIPEETFVVNENEELNHSSSAKIIESFTIESAISVKVTGESIDVVMPYFTSFVEIKIMYTIKGMEYPITDHIGTEEVALDIVNKFSVIYRVYGADNVMQDYTITVTRLLPFVPYPPGSSCTLNNTAAGIEGNCECVQDTTTLDVWTATTSSGYQCYNSLMSKNGICKDYQGEYNNNRGYIPNLNEKEMCGFKDGWNLPTQEQISTMLSYVKHLYNTDRMLAGKWFNDNGFKGIDVYGFYWGQMKSNGNVWTLSMNDSIFSTLNFPPSTNLNSSYGWGVHYSGK